MGRGRTIASDFEDRFVKSIPAGMDIVRWAKEMVTIDCATPTYPMKMPVFLEMILFRELADAFQPQPQKFQGSRGPSTLLPASLVAMCTGKLLKECQRTILP